MADEPENMVLAWMRRLDAKFDRMGEQMQDIKGRLTNVETALAMVATEVGSMMGADARMQQSIDRMSDRLERIERRLDLVDTAPPL
jgi:division protein CdvB (Snf7/Vps24/ESCRT-III family)